MKTVKKVLDVLEAFEKPQSELGVAQLVKLSGMNSSTVHRICAELCQRGYLVRSTTRGKYRLGQRFIKFYDSLSELNRLKEIALVFMQKLSREINESIALSILVGSELSDMAVVVSHHKLQLLSREGENLPLHCTSAGKIFLSQMGSESLERILRVKGLTMRTANTITDMKLLSREIASIRKQGFAFDDEEFELGIRSAAAEVRGRDGEVIAALAVIGPSVRISPQRLRDLIPTIQAASREISKVLGYDGR